MNLHPQAIAIVERLIREGRAGEKPFGIPLAAWQQAIEERDESRPLCPKCNELMHKSGFAWSGSKRIQRYRCQKCGQTTIKSSYPNIDG